MTSHFKSVLSEREPQMGESVDCATPSGAPSMGMLPPLVFRPVSGHSLPGQAPSRSLSTETVAEVSEREVEGGSGDTERVRAAVGTRASRSLTSATASCARSQIGPLEAFKTARELAFDRRYAGWDEDPGPSEDVRRRLEDEF